MISDILQTKRFRSKQHSSSNLLRMRKLKEQSIHITIHDRILIRLNRKANYLVKGKVSALCFQPNKQKKKKKSRGSQRKKAKIDHKQEAKHRFGKKISNSQLC